MAASSLSPASSTPMFSIDLTHAAKKHLSFLQDTHRTGITLRPVAKRSLERYVYCWLPLVAAHPDTDLVPPLDIAWLWHCHRLAPLRYESFCQRRFGTILEASPAFAFQDARNPHEQTALVWSRMFPQEPFFAWNRTADDDEAIADNVPSVRDLDALLDGFNILGSAASQAGFLWQVSGPLFQVEEFLQTAVDNYHKFLALSQGDLPLVPTYQIDLIWHTHMLTSVRMYNRDCLSIRGSKFHHDDSLNDRAVGGKLDLSFKDTCHRWEEAYGTTYEVAGGMYRGEPEPDYYVYSTWSPTHAFNSVVPMPQSAITTTTSSTAVAAMGATSTGSHLLWVVPSEHSGTFIKANTRIVGSNANPKQDNFIFGKGSLGDGYYSNTTKDFYVICKFRLAQKYKAEVDHYSCYDFNNCLCLGCSPSAAQMHEKELIKARMDELVELMAIVKTRLQSTGPTSQVTLADAKRNGAVGNNDKLAFVSGSGGTAYYDSTPYAFCSAAGCGGGGSSADGGGGGAACGAAGCGGGGGGGCGGGGCGGGGG